MSTQDLRSELMELEHQYWKAIQDGDGDAVMRLTADTCLVTGASGVGALPNAAVAEMMKKATWKLTSFHLDDAKAQQVSDDVAILAYKVHEELTVDGKKISLDAADASTWVRTGGTWRCALHTESILGDPFGRDRVSASAPAR
jgi:ketosteroid isomerase-like protein